MLHPLHWCRGPEDRIREYPLLSTRLVFLFLNMRLCCAKHLPSFIPRIFASSNGVSSEPSCNRARPYSYSASGNWGSDNTAAIDPVYRHDGGINRATPPPNDIFARVPADTAQRNGCPPESRVYTTANAPTPARRGREQAVVIPA